MKYTTDDLRGKYVKVGTLECDEFLKGCVELNIRWCEGSQADSPPDCADFIGVSKLFPRNDTLGHAGEKYWLREGFLPFVPKIDTVTQRHYQYTVEDLLGKYVEVGTKACEVFLQLCERLNIKWNSGHSVFEYMTESKYIAVHLDRCKLTEIPNGLGSIDNYTPFILMGVPVRPTTDEIDDTVTQRGERYGLFADGAVIMQDLKAVMRSTPGWERLTPSQREALEMIQHKIGRVLNGDPMYDDSWRDISGYSTLILNELNGVKR